MELIRALAALLEAPAPEHARLAELVGLPSPPTAAEHTGLFAFELYPYASVYLGAEGMLGGEARDRIAGFWRALGATPPPECDHLATLLGFWVRLEEAAGEGETSDRDRWETACRAFLWEHLASWLPVWLARLDELAPPFYRAWGRLLGGLLERETANLEPPDRLPLHLREAPPMADPRREGGDAFLPALLAPVRSGLILTRSDLERAARELGLGLRMGERRYALEALLGQESAPVLKWLAVEAERQSAARRGPEAPPEPIAAFWSGRAAASAGLLAELATEDGSAG